VNEKNTKIKSTYDKFIESLTPQRKKEFDEGYRNFVRSELALAIKAKDEVSVRKLTKMLDSLAIDAGENKSNDDT